MSNCKYCKNGFKKFSDDTTMHGFLELYNAKSFIWKIIWFFAIAAALSISAYQLHGLAKDVIQSPTTTVIEPLSNPLQYPPMQICYTHWIYWVDWKRAEELGFDKHSVMYSLRFLDVIISESDFNISKASENFKKRVEQNKMPHLIDFYDSISFRNPPGIIFETVPFGKWMKKFDQMQQFCYVASHDMISQTLSETNSSKLKFRYDVNYHKLDSNFVSGLEEFENFKQSLKKFLDPVHLLPDGNLTFAPFSGPPFMNFDAVNEKQFSPSKNIFQTQITVTAELFHWLNTSSQSCNSDPLLTSQYDHCDELCSFIEFRKSYPNVCLNMLEAWMLGIDSMANVCMHELHFLQSGKNIPGNIRENGYHINYQSDSYKECLKQYCTSPCDIWKYDSYPTNVMVPVEMQHLNLKHLFFISYETASILEMRQVQSQTWFTIIGNIGGIVGLWLGASILSVLQMIYLLCFAANDDKEEDGNKEIVHKLDK